MDRIVVRGGKALRGEVEISGSKNAALPLLFSSLLTAKEVRLRRLPRVVDVATAVRLLEMLGVDTDRKEEGEACLRADRVRRVEAPYELVKTMRASFLVLGPLVARFGHARVSTPGGCAIGARPVNLHLKGLAQMGASIRTERGYVEARASRLKGANIRLDFPSVGATENLIMAATLAAGTTIISNAAKEPEIQDLAAALTCMGARVEGAGTDVVTVEGVDELGGLPDHEVIPDRVEAGTYLVAGAVTRGEVLVRNVRPEHLGAFLLMLREAGIHVEEDGASVSVRADGRPRSVDVTTMPYPGFPTDLQAQVVALMALSEGTSVITETVFENRFMHVQELVRMGADVRLQGSSAIIRGVPHLSGAPVMATDRRASVSLVLAGLAAGGTTEVSRIYHLDRGYERIEEKLARLGADVTRVKG